MAARDNTKSVTWTLKACKPGGSYGSSDTLRNIARPGKRNNNVPKGAADVMTANGKTPGPGYKQMKPAGGGTGSIARPGHAQKITGKVR